MTNLLPFSNAIHPQIHLPNLPRNFLLFLYSSTLASNLFVRGMTDLTKHFPAGYFAEETIRTRPSSLLLFDFFSHSFFCRSFLSTFTSAPFHTVFTPSHSSRTQQRPTRSSTSWHCLTPIHPGLGIISKLLKQFFSTPIFIFAYKII